MPTQLRSILQRIISPLAWPDRIARSQFACNRLEQPAMSVVLLISFAIVTGCESSARTVDAPVESGSNSLDKSRNGTVIEETKETVTKDDKDDGVEHRISHQPVTVTLTSPRKQIKAGEEIEISIKLEVAALWELRSADFASPVITKDFDLVLPEGMQASSDWFGPRPQPSLLPTGRASYAGNSIFRRTIAVSNAIQPGEYPIQCQVRCQACDHKLCIKLDDFLLQLIVIVE